MKILFDHFLGCATTFWELVANRERPRLVSADIHINFVAPIFDTQLSRVVQALLKGDKLVSMA